jgi:hypothetical protein
VNRYNLGVADGFEDLFGHRYGLRAVLLHNLLEVVLLLGPLAGPGDHSDRSEVAAHLLLYGLLESIRGEEQVAHAEHFHCATSPR